MIDRRWVILFALRKEWLGSEEKNERGKEVGFRETDSSVKMQDATWAGRKDDEGIPQRRPRRSIQMQIQLNVLVLESQGSRPREFTILSKILPSGSFTQGKNWTMRRWSLFVLLSLLIVLKKNRKKECNVVGVIITNTTKPSKRSFWSCLFLRKSRSRKDSPRQGSFARTDRKNFPDRNMFLAHYLRLGYYDHIGRYPWLLIARARSFEELPSLEKKNQQKSETGTQEHRENEILTGHGERWGERKE